jgi:hypothetical protein
MIRRLMFVCKACHQRQESALFTMDEESFRNRNIQDCEEECVKCKRQFLYQTADYSFPKETE